MTTCEFCMYASDECYLLEEPINYDPSGMTVKDNCPMRKHYENIQIPDSGRQDVRGNDKSDR